MLGPLLPHAIDSHLTPLPDADQTLYIVRRALCVTRDSRLLIHMSPILLEILAVPFVFLLSTTGAITATGLAFVSIGAQRTLYLVEWKPSVGFHLRFPMKANPLLGVGSDQRSTVALVVPMGNIDQ